MGAVYRFNQDHWNYDQAYAEMKHDDFYPSNGHGKQLDFVRGLLSAIPGRKNQSNFFCNCWSLN